MVLQPRARPLGAPGPPGLCGSEPAFEQQARGLASFSLESTSPAGRRSPLWLSGQRRSFPPTCAQVLGPLSPQPASRGTTELGQPTAAVTGTGEPGSRPSGTPAVACHSLRLLPLQLKPVGHAGPRAQASLTCPPTSPSRAPAGLLAHLLSEQIKFPQGHT